MDISGVMAMLFQTHHMRRLDARVSIFWHHGSNVHVIDKEPIEAISNYASIFPPGKIRETGGYGVGHGCIHNTSRGLPGDNACT